MLFNCGKARETRDEYMTRVETWHKFFAILPRTIRVVDGQRTCVALQCIERKGTWVDDWAGGNWEYKYRLGASHAV